SVTPYSSTSSFELFFLHRSADPRALHSFPTRRSSDLPAEGFLTKIVDWCRANNVLFIADEIQTGFVRTGSWFASETEGIEPDLITLAKGIAGGMPLSAVTGRAEVMDAVHPGGLGGTYGGNPVTVAAALAAIDVMEEEHLTEKA